MHHATVRRNPRGIVAILPPSLLHWMALVSDASHLAHIHTQLQESFPTPVSLGFSDVAGCVHPMSQHAISRWTKAGRHDLIGERPFGAMVHGQRLAAKLLLRLRANQQKAKGGIKYGLKGLTTHFALPATPLLVLLQLLAAVVIWSEVKILPQCWQQNSCGQWCSWCCFSCREAVALLPLPGRSLEHTGDKALATMRAAKQLWAMVFLVLFQLLRSSCASARDKALAQCWQQNSFGQSCSWCFQVAWQPCWNRWTQNLARNAYS